MLHDVLPANTQNIKNITWSQTNHLSLSKLSIVRSRQELGREYVTITLDVYQVCHGVSCCIKMEVVLQPGGKVSGQCCWDIGQSQQMLDAIKHVVRDNFSASQCTDALNTVQ